MLFSRRREPPAAPAPSGRRLDGPDAAPWAIAHDPRATVEDIFFCFRLLLGRAPNREEWRGHASRAGEPLDGVVASYAGSLEFARRGLRAPTQGRDLVCVELDGFRIYAAPGDAAVGRYVQADNYEREVTSVFRGVLRPGMGVIDIGANIGYFTLLSAALVGPAGHVLAVEPNPDNARVLEASRRLNGFGHVVVAQVAAGRGIGLLVLNTAHSNGTTSTPPDEAAALLDSVTVPSLRVDALVAPHPRLDLIKADVEGAEYNALLGCAGVLERWHPVIISEFSPGLMPGISGVSGPDYLRWLIARGYRLSVIAPDGSLLAAGDDVNAVMSAHAARGTDHIDILARAEAEF